MNKIKMIVFVLIVPLFVYSDKTENNNETSTENLQAVNDQIDNYLRLSADLVNKNLDSAMYYAEKANNLIQSLTSDLARIEVYKHLGDIYGARGNFATSLSYYYNAKQIIDKNLIANPKDIHYLENQIELLNKIGASFFSQKNYEQALKYFDEAIQILEKNDLDSPAFVSNFKLRLFNNIAAIHIQRFEFDQAIIYYKSALELSAVVGNEAMEASLLNNLGICYMEKNNYGLAQYHFQTSLQIREELNDKRGIAQCYNNLGKNHALNSNFDKALQHFLKALELGREIGNKESILHSLQSLSKIYEELGDYEKAHTIYKDFSTLKDSLYNTESVNRIAQLEMQYKFEKQEMLFDLELKRTEAENAKAELIYLITGGSLFFLLITAILLIFLQRSKIRNARLLKDKLELEHKHISLEKQKLKEELEFKTRELTTNVMYLLKKNELITGISARLIKSKLDFKPENQRIIQEIINELKSNQDKDIWSEFETHFMQVHTDFYDKLNQLFPNLSSNEKKLCAFLRLNMSTKDISAITYQSVNSITVARSRLRKKLNIQGEEVHLLNFLMQL